MQGVGSDLPRFLDILLGNNQGIYGPTIGADYNGMYNSLQAPGGDPKWREKVTGAINGVRKRLPAWLQRRGSGG